MPEGDTLVRIARTLSTALVGRPFTSVDSTIPELREGRLVGRTTVEVTAHGKNLLIRLDDGRTIYSHLRMTGSWHVYRPHETWLKPRSAARLMLATREVLAVCFHAPVIELLAPGGEQRHAVLSQLGPDLLAPEIDLAAAAGRLVDPRAIGEVVMDQRVVAGIGNVYKSELLFLQRVDPWRPGAALTAEQRLALLREAQRLMRLNVDPELSSRTTRNSLGGPRKWVYGRSGEACLVCGEDVLMRRQGEAGRSTYYCPRCQGVVVDPAT
jgi:endonuclease VIII